MRPEQTQDIVEVFVQIRLFVAIVPHNASRGRFNN